MSRGRGHSSCLVQVPSIYTAASHVLYSQVISNLLSVSGYGLNWAPGRTSPFLNAEAGVTVLPRTLCTAICCHPMALHSASTICSGPLKA